MLDIIQSLVFGVVLVLLGSGLLWRHIAVWSGQRSTPGLEERERREDRLRFRRRSQVAILLIILGVMIPVGDWLMVQRKFPLLITFYWMAVLLLALWIMLLGASDWLSTRVHLRANRATLASLEQKRRELELEVERLRQQGRKNP